MRKKKPLHIEKPAGFGQTAPASQPFLPLVLAAIVILAAIILAAVLSLPKQAASGAYEEKIEIFLSAPSPFFENESAKVRVFSSCGNFSLFLDKAKIAEGESRAEALIKAAAGPHQLVAKNSRCSDSFAFSVSQKECTDGETAPCTVGACAGAKACRGGVFLECTLPLKTCVPGESTGCPLDSCRFGYMECNPCGTGFGKCQPSENTAIQNSLVCPPSQG